MPQLLKACIMPEWGKSEVIKKITEYEYPPPPVDLVV
jgi:hypothetical protein